MNTEQNTPNPTSNPNIQQQAGASNVQEGEPSRKLAFASLILGIMAVFSNAAGMSAGLLPGLPAVICGHKAVSRTKTSPAEYGGRGMAIVGLILGYIGCAISLTMITYLILGMLGIVRL
jgi:hypothetical protein